jgi:hypothetical protein
MARPAGIEPALLAPEASALSPELRALFQVYYTSIAEETGLVKLSIGKKFLLNIQFNDS